MINAISTNASIFSLESASQKKGLQGDTKKEAIYNFTYSLNNDEYYPCRMNGDPIYLSPLEIGSSAFCIKRQHNGINLDLHSAEKFFSYNICPKIRGQFYSDNLAVRPFTESDRRYVWPPSRQHAEMRLVGQLAVFSKSALSVGTCIGAYAGEVKDDTNMAQFSSRDLNIYGMEFHINSVDGVVKTGTIVGDGALSRINGIFEFNTERGWFEAEAGHNVGIAGVPARIVPDANEIVMPCCFAISNIKPGEELRIKYGYSDYFVNKLMLKKFD